jgi:hypothetical protein
MMTSIFDATASFGHDLDDTQALGDALEKLEDKDLN